MFNKGGQGRQRGFGFGGFSLASKKETPLPPTSALAAKSGQNNKAKQHGSSSQSSGLPFHEKRRL